MEGKGREVASQGQGRAGHGERERKKHKRFLQLFEVIAAHISLWNVGTVFHRSEPEVENIDRRKGKGDGKGREV